jgi:replicative DNA helicase
MVALFERGDSIDYHTVAAELEHQGTYQVAGGLVGLAELNVATPTSTHITYYAHIVADHALRRRFIGAAQHVAELAWDVRQDIETMRQRSEALVLGAATDTLSCREVLGPEAWTDHLLEFLDRIRTRGLAGISTGLRDLDTLTLGLSPGLHLLAASTGTGKTAMAGQVALHVAEHHGPVVFVSMELTDVDLGVRLVSVLTNIKKERLVIDGLTGSSPRGNSPRPSRHRHRSPTARRRTHLLIPVDPKPASCRMLQVSERAADELARLLSQSMPGVRQAVRLGLKPSGGLAMTIDVPHPATRSCVATTRWC